MGRTLAEISRIRSGQAGRFWSWLHALPGDAALVVCPLAGAVALALLSLVGLVSLAWLGEPAVAFVASVPYLLLLVAWAVFPGTDPVGERTAGLLLAFWIGGAPLAWGYVALAAGALTEKGRACTAIWTAASWLPHKAYELLVRLRSQGRPELQSVSRLSLWQFGVLLLLALVGLQFRLSRATLSSPPPMSLDSIEYDTLARQLVAGQPYQLDHSVVFRAPSHVTTHANRTPGYPAFLAAVYRLTPSSPDRQRAVAICVQCSLDIVTGLLLFLALCRVLPWLAALCGSAAWFSSMQAISSSRVLLSESLAAFLLTAALCLTLCVRRPAWWAGAGLATAAAALTRPELIGVPLVLVGAALVSHAESARRKLFRAGLLMAVFIAGVAPWAVANYRVLGHLVPTSTAGGFNFWIGNYLPFHGVVRAQSFDLAAEILRRQRVNPSDEAAVDQAMWAAGWRNVKSYLRHRPGRYALLLLRKCEDMWRGPFSLWLGPLGLLSWRGAVLLFFSLGTGVALLHGGATLPLWCLPLYQTLVHVISYAHGDRFIVPVLPMVFGLAAVGIWFVLTPRGGDCDGATESLAS